MAASNVGKWDRWYGMVTDPEPYGEETTYRLGAEFLSEQTIVEDWGCGKGWMRKFIPPERYRGIDGSHSPFCDEVVDLAEYRSEVPGIFMRHVLEHDYRWAEILDNAVASFTERMVLVVFTPMQETTREIAWNADPGVPDLGFCPDDLECAFGAHGNVAWQAETLLTDTQYGEERIWCIERL